MSRKVFAFSDKFSKKYRKAMIHTDLFTFPKDFIRIFVGCNDKPRYEKRVLHVKVIPPPDEVKLLTEAPFYL